MPLDTTDYSSSAQDLRAPPAPSHHALTSKPRSATATRLLADGASTTQAMSESAGAPSDADASAACLTLEQFLRYVRAFNARDYATQVSYYTSDIELLLPDPPLGSLTGYAAIIAHYKAIHSKAEETVVPRLFMRDPSKNRIFFVMDAFFKYFDTPERTLHGCKAETGDAVMAQIWAVYDMDPGSGRIRKITCNLFYHEVLGKVDVKERIRESERLADPGLRIT